MNLPPLGPVASVAPTVPAAPVAPVVAAVAPGAKEQESLKTILPPPRNPQKEKTDPVKASEAKDVSPTRSGLVPVMLVMLSLILVGGAAVYFASKEFGHNPLLPPANITKGDPVVNEANYIRIGWQKDAHKTLLGFMAATTCKDKLPYILNSQELATKVEDFYGGGVINDSDTPVDAFSIYELSEEDRKRGLFMMIYDQPPQFDMKEFFRPLASLEVQYGVDEADLLLSTVALIGNFSMEPLRVHALFKRTPEGLKLDWEIFAQTKYRTLQTFVELPEVGQQHIFRVFIAEDVPDKGKSVAGTRTYRVADPANTSDTARINVKVDSEIGRVLSVINWRGSKETTPINRTATVELKWAGESTAPELEITRFICWEFLGLGGQDGSANASNK